ncbi:MAG: hypothetical protein KAS17_10180 [Victivallaceae bacterium]|nr:hypothetical protein [Victivallaceae bacterium]
MDFLKRHYEKLILAFFLLVFVFLLIYLIDLSKSTHTITKQDLKIPTREPNYRKNDFSHKKYQTSYIFTKDCTWNKSIARSDKDKIYTDLLIPFKCARCPFGNKVIPRYYFFGPIDHPRNCPLCDKPLPRPPADDIKINIDEMDRDNDGIPNVDEIRLGLDPDNPDDALYDPDNDGFPNIYELQKKKKINNSASHPPFYERLHLIEFRETKLPFKLMLVNTNGGKKDPADWVIQINEMIRGKSKTKFKYLDDRMTLDKTSYTITKIDAKHEEKRRGGTIVKEDKSKIYLKSRDGKYTITMQVGKDVYSPKPKAIIEDLATGKKYHVGAKDTITMFRKTKPGFYKSGKPRRRKTIKYKVFKVDRQKKQVIIEDKKLKKYTITAKVLMPRIKQKDEGRTGGNPNANIGAPPGFMDAPPGGTPRNGRKTRRR